MKTCPTRLWDVRSTRDGGDGPWWNAPPELQRQAYYMTLRVHYQMPAAEALAMVRRNTEGLSLGTPPGFMGLLRAAIRPFTCPEAAS
jgi:hypothetical protein